MLHLEHDRRAVAPSRAGAPASLRDRSQAELRRRPGGGHAAPRTARASGDGRASAAEAVRPDPREVARFASAPKLHRRRGMDPSDEDLMGRYARGDGAAFQLLFRRYRRPVFEFFRRRTQSPERAADLTQELFLRVHSARASFRSDGAFQPWFFRIARHLCIDDLRRVERGLLGGPPPDELAARGSHDAESQLAIRQSITVLLDSLPPEQARILYASKGLGARYEEVAEAIGKSVEAVKQAASRALRRLRSAQESPDV